MIKCSHVHSSPAQDGRCPRRRGPGRRRRADRGAVDDDDRHGGCPVDGAAVHRAGRSGIGDGPGHGERPASRGRRPRNQAADARRRRHRAAHRRLPLQRPPAADALPGLRPGARQVPHQSRQRRHRAAARRAVLDDLRRGARQRQAGPHRRQRRLPQSGAGDRQDAGEHRPQSRADVRGDHQRVHGALGGAVHRAGARDRPAQGPDHHFLQDLAAEGPDCRLPRTCRAAPISRCTWA